MKVCGQKYTMEEFTVPAGENRQNLKQKDSFLFFLLQMNALLQTLTDRSYSSPLQHYSGVAN